MVTKKICVEKIKSSLETIASSYKKKDFIYWKDKYLKEAICKLNADIVDGIIDSWQISMLDTMLVFKTYFSGKKVEHWEFLPKNRKLWFKNIIISSDGHEGTLI